MYLRILFQLASLYNADVKHVLDSVYQISFSLQYAAGYKIFISELYITTFVQNQIFLVLDVESSLVPLNSVGTCKYYTYTSHTCVSICLCLDICISDPFHHFSCNFDPLPCTFSF